MKSPIRIAAERFPDQLAFDDGERQMTYSELSKRVSGAWFFNRKEWKPGDHIAWCPQNDLDAFVTFWSIQEHGLVACPISLRIPKDRRDAILKQLDAKWFDPVSHESVSSEAVVQTDPDVAGPSEFDVDQPATIILTSGSTGMPKAVVHSMRAHVASATGAVSVIPLNPGDRWLWSLPLCHVSGLSILVRCAMAGATVVGVSDGFTLNQASLHRLRVTHLSVVNTQLRRLMSETEFPSRSLKSILLGGSGIDAKLVEQARSRGVHLHTTYGLTEMASQVTTSTATADPASSGRVLPGRRLQLSPDDEILVGGDTLCLGYYHEKNINPVTDKDGWFHTKDLGAWTSDGELLVRGRIDNQFISGGENVHPENIERAMLETFGMEQVIVVPKPCETYGERPVAFVLGSLPDDWRDRLRQTLSVFEIPTEILPWPQEAESDIKPNRRMLRERVQNDPT